MSRGNEADVFVQQLVEHLALIVRDDAVADAREDQHIAVAANPFHGEQHHREDAEPDDAGEIPLDVGLIDQLSDQIGGQGRAAGGDAHQDERQDILAPVLDALLGEQPPHQGRRAVRIGKQRRELRLEHLLSTAAEARESPTLGWPPPSPVPARRGRIFQGGTRRGWAGRGRGAWRWGPEPGAWARIAESWRSSGCRPSGARARAPAATIRAGSPARRAANSTRKSTPAARLTAS